MVSFEVLCVEVELSSIQCTILLPPLCLCPCYLVPSCLRPLHTLQQPRLQTGSRFVSTGSVFTPLFLYASRRSVLTLCFLVLLIQLCLLPPCSCRLEHTVRVAFYLLYFWLLGQTSSAQYSLPSPAPGSLEVIWYLAKSSLVWMSARQMP